MSTYSITTIPAPATERPRRAHKFVMTLLTMMAIMATAAILVYGLGYYISGPQDRPYHPRHLMLKPSGPVGLGLGVFGFFLFALIFLYPLRKRWAWLGKMGNTRHWLDFHILMGLVAPVVIAFHASFKFGGIAGMAYWIMVAVAASGIVGRYVYAQIPRSRNSTELSLQESKLLQERLMNELAQQRIVLPGDLAVLFRLPSPQRVERQPMLFALIGLLWFDFLRPFRVARLRRHTLGYFGKLFTFGGLLRSRDRRLERVVEIAREQARMSKKLLFLSRSQQIFHLWHVIHRPFSYSFAVLALTHVVIAVLFGLLR